MIVSNWQRGRNNVEIGREGREMYDIESERAKQRRLATQNNNTAKAVTELVPQQAQGETRDIIGSKLGASGKTVEAAASVVKTADKMRENGRDQLRIISYTKCMPAPLARGLCL